MMRANQAQTRHEQDGKHERGTKRAEVVKRQNMGDDVAEVIAILDNTHQQGNLKSYENAHDRNKGIEDQFKTLGEGESYHQQRRRKAANHAEEQLNPDEAVNKPATDVPGERAADSHSEQICPDDRRELKHAVTDEVARQRAGNQLVNEAAGGHQQHRDEQQDTHTLVDRRGNDDAEADRHGANEDGQGHVVVLHDLFPEMVWGELIHHQERDDKYHDPDKGKN